MGRDLWRTSVAHAATAATDGSGGGVEGGGEITMVNWQ